MPASGHSDARLLRTDERRLIRRANPAHDHGSRQPGARPAFAPSSAREGRSAFAAARRTRGGRGHGVRLYRLCAVAALADAATRCPGAGDHGRGGRLQPAAGCHSGAGAAPTGRVDLAFLWPSLGPPDPNAKPPAPGTMPAPSQAFARVFMTIAAAGDTLAPADRALTIYPRYTAAEAAPGPGGLT